MAYHKRPQGSRSLTQRKKLLTIAGRLFWQKGYLATSIDDIAKAAKMNKASIYYYFKNKADVLYELASATMQALIDLQKGGRLVGIISHVSELRERIDARLEVKSGKAGSTASFLLT